MANRWGNNGNSDSLYFLGLQNHCRWWLQPWNSKTLAPWKEGCDNLSSVQLNRSVMSGSLPPHELQHTRPPCPSQTPRVYSNSCSLNWWCYPTTSSSLVPFSFHLQAVPVSVSFQMSQFAASGGQSIGVSASTSVFPMNTQDWSPLGWSGWISLQSKGLSRVTV